MDTKTNRLALRVTRNSGLMILAVYIVLQLLAYFRDNLIFGVADLSALPSTMAGFIGIYVLPPLAVFSGLIYAKALPIQRVALRLEAGETLDPALLELTRLRILRFSTLVLALNIIGFTLGSVLLVVLAGNYHEFLEFDRLVIIASNLAGSVVYAAAQTALNNVAFAPVRDRLGIREIGTRKREMPTARRQVYLTALVAFYALSFLQFNNRDVLLAARVETDALQALREDRITREDLPAEYRRLLAERLPSISTRTTFDAATLPLPWEAGIDYPRVQKATFALFALFMIAVALFVQACVSRDLGGQIRGLARRLRDLLEGGGDLRVRINLQAMDDLGELTELQNRLLDRFHGIALRIGEAAAQTREGAAAIDRGLAEAERVSSRAGESVQALEADLAARAEESRGLGEALGSFREAVARVNEAAGGQRRVVADTQAAMADMAASIREVEGMTGRAGELSGDLAGRGAEGGEAMAGTRTAIGAIEEASRAVLEVLGSLGKIASNINLLAMNAAIEAAHAGQHGLGFAVVADEVRALAATATKDTKAIKALIATMTDRIGEGVRRAETSGAALDRLVGGLRESADISREIAVSARRQGEGTRAVEASLGEVVASCESIGQRMAEQARATEAMAATLSAAMSRLEGLAAASKAQSEGMRELEESFRAVRREVDRNLAAVDALGAEVGRFKV